METRSVISIDLVFDGSTALDGARRSVSVSADGSFRRRKPVVPDAPDLPLKGRGR